MPEKELYFLPLGGAGEIGMNLNLFGYGDEWIIVDLGVTFGEPHLPGIDLVMADPGFIAKRKKKLLGIVLTHAHEDHFGAIPYLWPELECPVYATAFTAELLRRKLDEVGLREAVPLHEVPLDGSFKLGPFGLRYITITHSILEPNALAIDTPLGTVFHSGDWKIDPDPQIGEATDEAALNTLGREGVLAMICDSTNVFNAYESGSEAGIYDHLKELVASRTGRVAVTGFASNVARVQTIAQVGHDVGRHVVLVGRSLKRNVEVAKETGYLGDFPPLVDERDADYLPPDKLLMICTGSQGEPRGAMTRIAFDDHPNVHLEEGDTAIFSSKIIPGNEIGLAKVYNALARNGVEIITEKEADIHVSGHPGRPELTRMYQWIKPEIAIPVHGEDRHLHEHARLAEELQVPHVIIPRNGTLIRLAPGRAEIVDHVEHGRLVLDGNRLVGEDSASIVERRRASYNGYINVTLVVAGKKLAVPPGIALLGIPDAPELQFELGEVAESAAEKILKKKRWDEADLAETVRRAVRRACRDLIDKKPVTEVQIAQLPARS